MKLIIAYRRLKYKGYASGNRCQTRELNSRITPLQTKEMPDISFHEFNK
jgi:hypothetical protein